MVERVLKKSNYLCLQKIYFVFKNTNRLKAKKMEKKYDMSAVRRESSTTKTGRDLSLPPSSHLWQRRLVKSRE